MADETQEIEGHCLCGAIRVRMTPPVPHVEACHCTVCRRWGGGAYLSLRGVPDPEIEGTEHIVRYPSSDWAERGFCRTCGSHLFYFYKPKSSYSFAAGLFDGADSFTLDEEIFIDEKPGYYDFAGQRERLTAAEVIAKYSPSHGDT